MNCFLYVEDVEEVAGRVDGEDERERFSVDAVGTWVRRSDRQLGSLKPVKAETSS